MDCVSRWWQFLVAKLVGILSCLLLLVFGLFLCVVFSENPEWVFTLLGISKGIANGMSPKYEALKFLGIGMGGILLALQALASHKRAKAMEDAANAQAGATAEQAKANQNTEQGQRQERLKNAIEHLGHPSDSVRLLGAYELFHLAKDTEDLRQMALDNFCARIRLTTGEDGYREKYKSKPSEEVQSLLTLLFVQKHEVFEYLHVNLQGSWLNGANLSGARLQGAELSEVQLQGAELSEAQLQGAELSEAQLQEAMLLEAHLQGAKLSGAQLQRALLFDTHLQGAELLGAQLQGAESGTSAFSESFEDRIRRLIGKKSDLSGVVFSGGLNRQCVNSFVECLSDEKTKESQEILEQQIGQPPSHELPEDRGAVIGAYTQEDAERWIAEYKQAMSKVPGAGDS